MRTEAAGFMKNRCETRTVFVCRGCAGLIFSLHLDKSVYGTFHRFRTGYTRQK